MTKRSRLKRKLLRIERKFLIFTADKDIKFKVERYLRWVLVRYQTSFKYIQINRTLYEYNYVGKHSGSWDAILNGSGDPIHTWFKSHVPRWLVKRISNSTGIPVAELNADFTREYQDWA